MAWAWVRRGSVVLGGGGGVFAVDETVDEEAHLSSSALKDGSILAQFWREMFLTQSCGPDTIKTC